MNVLDLFSGTGAFSLGLERAGMRTVAFCERDEYCQRVLAKHWPDVPCYDDVRTLTADRLRTDGIRVNAICGGFPCQNVSIAATVHGGHTGLDGEQSGLWSEYDRLIGELSPQAVIIENVDRLVGNGLDRVLRCLAARGYDAEWDVLPAWFFGAPQLRKRIWIIAYPSGQRMEGLLEGVRAGATRQGWPGGSANLLDVAGSPFIGRNSFPQPLLRGVDDRPANWVDRLHALGNRRHSTNPRSNRARDHELNCYHLGGQRTMKPIRTYSVHVNGFDPKLYSARSPAKARAAAWRDYTAAFDVSFKYFIQIARVYRVDDPHGVGRRVLILGEPATVVVGHASGHYVHFMRDGSDNILCAHPEDVSEMSPAVAALTPDQLPSYGEP